MAFLMEIPTGKKRTGNYYCLIAFSTACCICYNTGLPGICPACSNGLLQGCCVPFSSTLQDHPESTKLPGSVFRGEDPKTKETGKNREETQHRNPVFANRSRLEKRPERAESAPADTDSRSKIVFRLGCKRKDPIWFLPRGRAPYAGPRASSRFQYRLYLIADALDPGLPWKPDPYVSAGIRGEILRHFPAS